jgi:tRNA dimethylallyltransferase
MMIAIVGTTASGKTDLAIELARQFDGEIICADSRTIYRGMDIGTAKPTAEERAAVPHHLLDVVEPGERLNAAEFKHLAEVAERDILSRGHLPMLVGGSGMYADAVLYDYQFPGGSNAGVREALEELDDETLDRRLAAEDPQVYQTVDLKNRRRVIRALETAGQGRGRRTTVRDDILVLGLMLNKEIVQKRVEQRVKKMLEKGFIDEVRTVGERYGWDCPALEVIGYKAFKEVCLGTKSVAEATADFVRGDMALYKKQVTWFKRNPEIHWLEGDAAVQAGVLIQAFTRV